VRATGKSTSAILKHFIQSDFLAEDAEWTGSTHGIICASREELIGCTDENEEAFINFATYAQVENTHEKRLIRLHRYGKTLMRLGFRIYCTPAIESSVTIGLLDENKEYIKFDDIIPELCYEMVILNN
jgi:hypothetical protein